MSFATIKFLHLGCIATSYMLFFVRGFWSLNNSPMLQQYTVKVIPHVVDTVLLTSAITLAVMLGISPANTTWLLAKIIALLLYIGLGSFAIKHGKTHQTKLIAWIAAQVVFLYIVATAISHNPMPWFQ